MSCNVTLEGRQTEFEFFRQLIDTPDGSQCCGPLTTMMFTKTAMRTIAEFLAEASQPLNHLDNFDPRSMGMEYITLTMCGRHWLQHSDVLHKGSHMRNRQDWNNVSYYILHALCLKNSWDAKELSNYLGSAHECR